MSGLWPREHGAYAQIGVPIATALCLATPSAAAGLIAVGSCLAFLANEPLVVLLGHRGARRQEELHDAAVRRLGVTSLLAAVAGVGGLLLASATVLAVAAAVAVPSAVMLWMSWRRSAHSMIGEVVAAVALPGASAPVAVASGTTWPVAVQLWLAWTVGYIAGVVAVHHVIARRRGPTKRDARRIAILVGLTVASVAATFLVRELAIAVPLATTSTAVAIRAPSPRQLRAIGVGLVVVSALSAGLAVALF